MVKNKKPEPKFRSFDSFGGTPAPQTETPKEAPRQYSWAHNPNKTPEASTENSEEIAEIPEYIKAEAESQDDISDAMFKQQAEQAAKVKAEIKAKVKADAEAKAKADAEKKANRLNDMKPVKASEAPAEPVKPKVPRDDAFLEELSANKFKEQAENARLKREAEAKTKAEAEQKAKADEEAKKAEEAKAVKEIEAEIASHETPLESTESPEKPIRALNDHIQQFIKTTVLPGSHVFDPEGYPTIIQSCLELGAKIVSYEENDSLFSDNSTWLRSNYKLSKEQKNMFQFSHNGAWVQYVHHKPDKLHMKDATIDYSISQYDFVMSPLVLDEILRVLKPQGRLCIIITDGNLELFLAYHKLLTEKNLKLAHFYTSGLNSVTIFEVRYMFLVYTR